MPLDKPQNIPNSSLSTPYTIVNSDVAELGTTVATFYSGTTAQRPTINVVIGDQFYNTQLKQLEVYTDNGWIADSTAPQAPTNVTASNTAVAYGGTPSAIIKWVNSPSGSPASSYTVTSTPGSLTSTGNSSPLTINGLTAGTSYTFTVIASNTYGFATSSLSSSLTAGTISQPPTSITAAIGANSATVSFTAPSNTGASPVTSYTVYSTPDNISATGTSSPIIITGLTNGTSYTFTVVANNNAGTSIASSASNAIVPSQGLTIDYLVIAGGGGGGFSFGGGGGAGGYLTGSSALSYGTSTTITVGGGGAGGNNDRGINGTTSSFGTISSTTGGGGGGADTPTDEGKSGGSGGGGSIDSSVIATGVAGQGNSGGLGNRTGGYLGGGGGGGAGAVGGDKVGNTAGRGGDGLASSITGSSVFRAAGGGGGPGQNHSTNGNVGGTGGGGSGVYNGTSQGTDGTGSGGGGGSQGNNGANGGSGTVIIRYTGTTQKASGGSVSTFGGNTIHTFTSSGSFIVASLGAPVYTYSSTTPVGWYVADALPSTISAGNIWPNYGTGVGANMLASGSGTAASWRNGHAGYNGASFQALADTSKINQNGDMTWMMVAQHNGVNFSPFGGVGEWWGNYSPAYTGWYYHGLYGNWGRNTSSPAVVGGTKANGSYTFRVFQNSNYSVDTPGSYTQANTVDIQPGSNGGQYIAEFLCWNANLSDTEINQITTALRTKYNF